MLSRKVTDVILVSILEWPDEIFALPTSIEGRAAWYSFAFFLRTAATAELDVDTNELNAGFRSLLQNGKTVGQAFLFDSLENGAGYCKWLSNPNNFLKILDQCNESIENTIGSIWLNKEHFKFM